MIENVKNFCDECRRLNNRSGNKQVQQFLLDAQPFVRNLADELQRATSENALLKTKLEDAEERAANWKELATAKGVEPKSSQETQPGVTTEETNKPARRRYDYKGCLNKFMASGSELLRIPCKPYKGIKEPHGAAGYFPSLYAFRNQISKNKLSIDSLWNAADESIVLIRRPENEPNEALLP